MLDLAIVLPIFNEDECVNDVVNAWLDTCNSLGLQFRLIALNDGSSDDSLKVLQSIRNVNLEIVDKVNSGHGPTILLGYRKATQIAEWVFQCDSDDEMQPDFFPLLWNKRYDYDFLLGIRDNRQQNLARRLISQISRLTIRCLFGNGVTDVNSPYRLMKASILAKILASIPNNTFAPNLIISGAFMSMKTKFYEEKIPHFYRRTGTVSIMRWKLWKSVVLAFWQTITFRVSILYSDLNKFRQSK